MSKFTITALLLFLLTNAAWAQQPSFSIEAQYAPNEINDNDFFSINFGVPVGGFRSGHMYTQISYSGLSNPYGPQHERLRNIFFGVGAEYHARVSPFFEAGVSADTFLILMTEVLLNDSADYDYDCIERHNCLNNNGDSYVILGARMFITRQITLGAFIEKMSFANSHSNTNTRLALSGMNLRFFF